MEAPPPVPDLRQDRLLRREPQPPRERPLPRRRSRDHPQRRVRRRLDLVLRRRGEPPQDRGHLGGGRPLLRGRHLVCRPGRSSRPGRSIPARTTSPQKGSRSASSRARIGRFARRASSTPRRPPRSRRSPAGTGRTAGRPRAMRLVPPRTADREQPRFRVPAVRAVPLRPGLSALSALSAVAQAGLPGLRAEELAPSVDRAAQRLSER